MKKIALLTVLFLCVSVSVNAQFLKKLGQKIENAAEKTIERKAEQKTQKETEKAFDSAFNKKSKNKKTTSFPSISNVAPKASYVFSHKAEMQIKSGKEVMDIAYYLPDSGNFLCAEINDKRIKGKNYTVFDVDREAMFSFIESEGQKIKIGVSFKTDESDREEEKFEITETGKTKIILGYNCKVYKMVGEDMTATIWVTKEVDIRFPSDFYKIKQDKKTNNQWMKDLDGWAMEMVMIDTSKRRPQTITMTCLSIENSNLKINSSDYNNIGQ
ncbi:DUF4412 domain-containing protein [Algibacter sp. AS12]|uniref:DUF4412 domain-containing protein n=1 Tax=Algibacter sp. AS12 TaxID=3135773 RepID=UPI00398B55E7